MGQTILVGEGWSHSSFSGWCNITYSQTVIKILVFLLSQNTALCKGHTTAQNWRQSDLDCINIRLGFVFTENLLLQVKIHTMNILKEVESARSKACVKANRSNNFNLAKNRFLPFFRFLSSNFFPCQEDDCADNINL